MFDNWGEGPFKPSNFEALGCSYRFNSWLGFAKTHQTPAYGKGYSFLGFWLSSRSRRMRPKSVEKFQEKVRSLTVRCHNLDATAVGKLNQVIRGTAQFFATRWSTGRKQFRLLDRWLRGRLRAMKFKRRWITDNHRMRNKDLARLGLLSLESFCWS